jgi:hypothetical protein
MNKIWSCQNHDCDSKEQCRRYKNFVKGDYIIAYNLYCKNKELFIQVPVTNLEIKVENMIDKDKDVC